jgi:hypothetical protein
LALRFTALPFHPFAFESPLAAIDYDGYVNTTQYHIDGALMEHVLGSIVESCQTVTSGYVNTTQNHTDSDLRIRVLGHIIDARQAGAVVPVVAAILAIVSIVVLGIIWIQDDDPVRGNDDVGSL